MSVAGGRRALRLIAVAAFCCLAVARAAGGAPSNDAFAAAQALGGATGTVGGSNVDATREAGEAVPDPSASGKTVWFTWQATFSGPASFDTRGSSFDTYVAVYTGTRVDRLTWVAGNDIDFSVGSARAQFTAVAGTVYRVQVDGMRGESGAISLTWNRQPPPNDNFAAAQAISGESGAVDGTNLLATAEPGEPSAYGQGHSIWYRWTAPATALYEFKATGAMPLFVVAYTGSSLASLTWQASNVDTSNARLRLSASAGTTYALEVDSASFQNTGALRVEWSRLVAPSNDAFAAAQRLDPTPGTVGGDVWGATAEPGEPEHAGRPPHASVWYRWRAPASVEVSLAVDGNQFNCGTGVYTGTALTALTPIVSHADYGDCDVSRAGVDASSSSRGAPCHAATMRSKSSTGSSSPLCAHSRSSSSLGSKGCLNLAIFTRRNPTLRLRDSASMLEDFTVETFSGRIGDRFRVTGHGSTVVEAQLTEATAVGAEGSRGAGERAPFSLVFRGPLEPILPQRIYRFEHEALGAFDLFIVPIGPDEAGMQYEAVFA